MADTKAILDCGPAYAWAAIVAKNRYRLVRPYGRQYQMYLRVAESPMMLHRLLGTYEPAKVAWLERTLNPGMTFVDVGVNKGDFSLLAASLLHGQGKVLAFEPEAENCTWIRKSIQANGFGDNIQLFEMALADYQGVATLNLGTNSGAHSIVATQLARSGETIDVPVNTLDSVLSKLAVSQVDAIKIDVEGAEESVLAGARTILTQSNPIKLAVDVHPQYGVDVRKIVLMLEEMGFSVFDSNGTPIDVTGLTCDELYAEKMKG
jgi:FkbM family methyltransferase